MNEDDAFLLQHDDRTIMRSGAPLSYASAVGEQVYTSGKHAWRFVLGHDGDVGGELLDGTPNHVDADLRDVQRRTDGRHTDVDVDTFGAFMVVGVASADAELNEGDTAWGYNPYFGRVRDAVVAYEDTHRDVYVGDIHDTGASLSKTVDVYVDMDEHSLAFSLNGHPAVDAQVSLPPAVRAWARVNGAQGQSVRLDVVPESRKGAPTAGDKFVSRALVLGQPVQAARGLGVVLGLDNEQLGRKLRSGIQAVVKEFRRHGTLQDIQNLEYVLNGVANKTLIPEHVKAAIRVGKYHGGALSADDFDHGHDGMTLDSFVAHEASRIAMLDKVHVLVLRLYTTSSFTCINNALRAGTVPHPFRMTVYYMAEAIRKLRAVGAMLEPQSFTQIVYLWRGMKDMRVTNDFLKSGGSECGCGASNSD